MAASYFPTEHLSVHVPDPGFGYVEVVFAPADAQRYGVPHDVTLRGPEMMTALRSLTKLACNGPLEPVAGIVDKLWSMTVGQAKLLLPALQEAILYAAAGSDRAERLTPDEEESFRLMCATCRKGAFYSEMDCEQFGHVPFGYAGNWQQAEVQVERDNQHAERMRQLAAPVPAGD